MLVRLPLDVKSRSQGFITIVLGAGALLWVVGLLMTGSRPPLRDFSPGASFDIGPYAQPDGCPDRIWKTGDFVPRACLAGNTYGLQAHRFGLQVPTSSRSSFPQGWVRYRRDALGVTCALRCRVETIARDRFATTASQRDGQVSEPPAPAQLNWRRAFLQLAIPVACLGVALGLWFRPRR